MTAPWNPNSVPRLIPEQPPHSPWESTPSSVSETAPISVPQGDQWVYVDPNSYSDPFAQEPIYTSGEQAVPGASTGTMPFPPLPSVKQPASSPDPFQGLGIPPQPQPGIQSALPENALPGGNDEPEKGELKIKERRSWKTWQLLTAVVIAGVLGMWFNGNAGSASGSASSAGG